MALRLTYITSNDHKFEEASKILPGLTRLKLDLPELQTLDVDELIGAKLAAAEKMIPDAHERILIVEDGAHYFEGCGNLPGPFIKFFLKELGGADGLYKFAQAYNVTRARVTLHVGVKEPGKAARFFESVVPGAVVAPRGPRTFGFDPMFVPDGQTQTYAEMTKEEKNAISHRALALGKVKDSLQEKKLLNF